MNGQGDADADTAMILGGCADRMFTFIASLFSRSSTFSSLFSFFPRIQALENCGIYDKFSAASVNDEPLGAQCADVCPIAVSGFSPANNKVSASFLSRALAALQDCLRTVGPLRSIQGSPSAAVAAVTFRPVYLTFH